MPATIRWAAEEAQRRARVRCRRHGSEISFLVSLFHFLPLSSSLHDDNKDRHQAMLESGLTPATLEEEGMGLRTSRLEMGLDKSSGKDRIGFTLC